MPTPRIPRTAEDRCRDLTYRLAAETGLDFKFGYIGNVTYELPETHPRFRDDRLWMVFAPHPGRVGTDEDHIGGHRTEDLADLACVIATALRTAKILGRKGR